MIKIFPTFKKLREPQTKKTYFSNFIFDNIFVFCNITFITLISNIYKKKPKKEEILHQKSLEKRHSDLLECFPVDP